VLGVDKEAARYLGRLTAVVEGWRNPYFHRGFEKGYGARIPANDTDITQVCELFDEVD
jgi:hypothetical protein